MGQKNWVICPVAKTQSLLGFKSLKNIQHERVLISI